MRFWFFLENKMDAAVLPIIFASSLEKSDVMNVKDLILMVEKRPTKTMFENHKFLRNLPKTMKIEISEIIEDDPLLAFYRAIIPYFEGDIKIFYSFPSQLPGNNWFYEDDIMGENPKTNSVTIVSPYEQSSDSPDIHFHQFDKSCKYLFIDMYSMDDQFSVVLITKYLINLIFM